MDKNVVWIDENEKDLEEVSLARAHGEGLLHRISVVYLTDDNGQILIQERNDGRLDHSAAGHVDAGESYLEAAKRELEEELGVANAELNVVGTCSSSEADGKIKHNFKVFQYAGNPGKLDPEEVMGVFWSDPKKIWEDMRDDDKDKKYCGGFKSTLTLYLK